MKPCRHCGELIEDDAVNCPMCRRSVDLQPIRGELDRGLSAAMERANIDALLERNDVSSLLTRDLDERPPQPLTLAEIDQVLERTHGDLIPSLAELENVLNSRENNDYIINGLQLSELLDDGVATGELLRRGLIFLKNRRYKEALEWWTLNREQLPDQEGRASMLMLVMELLTCTLAENAQRAMLVRQQMISHPCYSKYRREK